MKNLRVRISREQNYTLLNFQPPQIRTDIQRWLKDEEGSVLVLAGEPSSGRSYSLESACFNQEFRDRPYVVATLDWSRIRSGDALGYIKECIQDLVDSEQERESWFDLVASALGSEIAIPAAVGASLLINIGGLLETARKLLPALDEDHLALEPSDTDTALRRLVQVLSEEQHLVLHIRHGELLSYADAWWIDDLCRTLHGRALSLRGKANEPGNVRLAISTSEVREEYGEQTSIAQLEKTWFIEFRAINFFQLEQVLAERFSPNLFETGYFSPGGPFSLKRWFNKHLNFSPLNRRFADLIHDYSMLQSGNGYSQPALLRNLFAELICEDLLIQDGGYWQLNPDATEQEINSALGQPVRKWNSLQLQKVDGGSRPAVSYFLRVAALCDPTIPWKRLSEYVSSEKGISQDELIAILREYWFSEPALFRDKLEKGDNEPEPGGTWSFANPLLAIAERPDQLSEEARRLLVWLSKQLEEGDRRHAGLFLQLASWAGEEQYAEWRAKLNWWVADEFAPLLERWVEQQLMTHQMQADALIKNLRKFQESGQKAILSASEKYFATEGGVPISEIGMLFNFNKGIRTDDREEALAYLEEALMIARQIFSEGHDQIVIIQTFIDTWSDAELMNRLESGKNQSRRSKTTVAHGRARARPSISAEKSAKSAGKRRMIQRNEPCPCGSGRRFKRCCGKLN